MSLYRLLYVSENQIEAGQGALARELSSILKASNRNNRPLGLTGALVFDDLWFLQVLEGERDDVWRTFERIRTDPRHDGVRLVEFLEVEERTFGNWWMGLAMRNERTRPHFAPFVQNNVLQVKTMRPAQILGLMRALAGLGLHRELAAGDI